MGKFDSRYRPLPSHYAGVPIGGVGCGCIETGSDALFRNVTINNNRTAATRIPFAKGSFLALRVAQGEQVHTRILQSESSVPFEKAGIDVTYTPREEISWKGLYPISDFQLKADNFPLDVSWNHLSPIIPYDTEASTLPLMMTLIECTNTSSERLNVAGLFNWENLYGCTAEKTPDDRGSIRRVFYTEYDETMHAEATRAQNVSEASRRAMGLSFALDDPCAINAQGNYCLAANPARQTTVTTASWRKDSPEDIQSIWQSFTERGALPSTLCQEDMAHCGSVCASAAIAPGATRRFLFLFSWYCPTNVVGNDDLGNAYATEFSNSLEVAAYGLKHAQYFRKSVSAWHDRFLNSSLPKWYARMLINSCHVFSTNTIHTRDGDFAMFESPQEPITAPLDRSFYSSLGVLLFFPELAEHELELLSNTDREKEPGRIYRDLGKGTPKDPGYGASSNALIELNAKFILVAYRNFIMTGNKVALVNLFPKLRQAMEYGKRLDTDGDGIPDAQGESTTFNGWAFYGLSAYAGGLWIVAMLAYAEIARHLKHAKEARHYIDLARQATVHFEERLWDEEEGYYRLFDDSANTSDDHPTTDAGCLSSQLVGAWCANFLKLPAGFSHNHAIRALEAIDRLDRRPGGIAKAYRPDESPCNNPKSFPADPESNLSWPAHVLAAVACPYIYHGAPDKGFETIRTVYKTIHQDHKRTYNQPLSWDPIANDAYGPMQDRHMGVLSIWHSLFALQGLTLSIPDQRITIAPQLPKGIDRLIVPIVTPVAFGRINYKVRQKPTYQQKTLLTFESPVPIRIVDIGIPRSLENPNVRMKINEDQVDISTEILHHEPHNWARISLKNPLETQHPVEIIIGQS